MTKIFRTAIRCLPSDNRKSKIQNLKWLGLSVIALVLVVTGAVASAQQPKDLYRIGYLSGADHTFELTRSEAFRHALRELGYIEGQNIAIEYRYAKGEIDRFPELAAELVRLKVDIIVVSGGYGPIQAAKNATKTIPIVMLGLATDPVESGLVASLARPGGNVSGLTTLSRELGGKRLELLKEIVPKLSRVAGPRDFDPTRQRTSVKRDGTDRSGTRGTASKPGGKRSQGY